MPADPYAIAPRFNKFLRVTDVVDGLDAVGRADLTLPDAAIRPLWMGVRFFGPAVTIRLVPANVRMPRIDRKDALRQHAMWGEAGHWSPKMEEHVKKGCVLVTAAGGARETGYWGSNNAMAMEALGVAGIVTDGNCRDTDEVIAQRNQLACRGIGRPIIPGRVDVAGMNDVVGFGGAQVRPGDIVGCDWDGTVVVPAEVAEDVLHFAARIAIDDKKARRRLYEKTGRKPDETVDWEAAQEYFKDLL